MVQSVLQYNCKVITSKQEFRHSLTHGKTAILMQYSKLLNHVTAKPTPLTVNQMYPPNHQVPPITMTPRPKLEYMTYNFLHQKYTNKVEINCIVINVSSNKLKMPSKFVCILRTTFSDTQLCGRCLVNMTPVVKVVIHCVFALL